MTGSPVGYLDFFILEASEYVQQLDSQLHEAGGSGPDADGLQRVARALRGSATMAKITTFADLAAGLERVGRAIREGALQWSPALAAALVGAVDDCKVLLHNARTWSPDDDRRAQARIVELSGFAAARDLTPLATPTTQGHDLYLAAEASNIGAGLELLATRPADRDAAANVLGRVRALRGIAGVKDHAAFNEVLEAAEQAARPLEQGELSLSDERLAVLVSAANVLRGIAVEIRGGRPSTTPSPEAKRFSAAFSAMQETAMAAPKIVPISELFYDDGGATIVEVSQNPPTTPMARFRLESVSHGEHLRRLAAEARVAQSDEARERASRGLRQALRALREFAESYGERDIAAFIAAHDDAATHLDTISLDALDEIAQLLSDPSADSVALGRRVTALTTSRLSTPFTAVAAVPADSAPLAPTPTSSTPSSPTSKTHQQRMIIPAMADLVAPTHAPEPEVPATRIAAAIPTPSTARAAVVMQPAVTATPAAPQAPIPTPAPMMTPVAARNAAPATPAPSRPPELAASAARMAPKSARLGELLDAGIKNLGSLDRAPLTAPSTIPDQPPVPIEVLLYRGRAAVERCVEIRDDAKRHGGVLSPDAADELFDLLDLALTD